MPSLADTFQRELIDAAPTPQARLAVISVLAKYAGATLYLPTQPKSTRRVAAARHALGNGMSDADVASILRERYGISSRQAGRDVKAAKTNV
jgi:hypothetical protein